MLKLGLTQVRADHLNWNRYRDFLLRYLPMISKEHIDAIRESSLSESEWKGEVTALIKKNKLLLLYAMCARSRPGTERPDFAVNIASNKQKKKLVDQIQDQC